jgi:hypothetical protein
VTSDVAGLRAADHDATCLESHWSRLPPAHTVYGIIRRRVGEDVTVCLVLVPIVPRLDYCNAMFTGQPQCTMSMLLRVQNAAARLVFELRPQDPISPAIIQL